MAEHGMSAVDHYTATRMEFDRTPAAVAVLALASRIADALGNGWAVAPEGVDRVPGLLEVPVLVTEGGVFGGDVATVTGEGGTVDVILDDDALPIQQLQALLEQLRRFAIRRDLR